jgi:CdiI immunity protein
MTDENENLPFDPGNFPALLAFLPAYLHQDFREEYDSAADALTAFLSEASGDEIGNVREEWTRFRKNFAGRPLREIQGALEQLGSAWLPEKEAELKRVDEILTRGEA